MVPINFHFLPTRPLALAIFRGRGQLRLTGASNECFRICRQVQCKAELEEARERPKAFYADRQDLPFAELKIDEVSSKVGGVRVRQHSNPLRRELQVPAAPLNWEGCYADPSTRPAHAPLAQLPRDGAQGPDRR
eukprot:CAMPEP_0177596510 /NCGR_PEP_ID=MMETSP0419_2-20121207/11121_1 /TAXON_ID=582737 /ORGANISM="Tetraselmis sp., Strain GSL018" /LENGTH=133 /DNA_ID=CAMNT_0019088427 /DNA_START=53 /DNA_END=450 /DNA_ORIENTATION=+